MLLEQPKKHKASTNLASYPCNMSVVDKQLARKFIEEEAMLHDAIVAHLDPIMRTQPHELLAITDEWVDLYVAFATAGVRPVTFRHAKENTALPPILDTFRELLVGVDSKGKRYLTETKMIILDAATRGTKVNSDVKKRMALSILNYMQDQARIIIRCNNNNNYDEFGERPPVVFSPLCTVPRWGKQFLQIPRQFVSWSWDKSTKETKIKIPYCANHIRVAGTASCIKHKTWDIMVLTLTPGLTGSAPPNWSIDLISADDPYLLKYHQFNSSVSYKPSTVRMIQSA